jgi:phage shock protein PspC (stress-responsive transcriptional regulator)
MATTPTSNRFFEWIRGLALDRQPGWIGGVCAGIAARIGIDPVIVRGIAVVIAVLGGPVVLLYAVAWLLLPTREGSIHLQNLTRGVLDRAVPGIVVLFLLALLPLTQGFWYLGSAFWSDPYGYGSLGASIGRAIWTLALIVVGIWFVIWIARRNGRGMDAGTTRSAAGPAASTAGPGTSADTLASGEPAAAASASAAAVSAAAVSAAGPATSAAFADGPATSAAFADGTTAAAASTVLPDLRPEPPVALSPDPTSDELADWKNRQAEWKLRFDAWKREQAAVTREQRLARVAEARERANSNATERTERVRQRRAANPRLRPGIVAIALGIALLAGGIAALSTEGSRWSGATVTVGFAAATIVIGVTMIIAGAFRRRVGFLGFIVALLTVVTLTTAFLPTDRAMLMSGANIPYGTAGRYAMVEGTLSIGYNELTAAAQNGGVIDIWKGHGDTWIDLPAGTAVRLEATTLGGRAYANTAVEDSDGNFTTQVTQLISTTLADGTQRYEQTLGAGKRHVTIRIWQGGGSINVEDRTATLTQEEENK